MRRRGFGGLHSNTASFGCGLTTGGRYIKIDAGLKIELRRYLRKRENDPPRMNAQLLADSLCAADTWTLENHKNHNIWCYVTWGRGHSVQLLAKYGVEDSARVQSHPNVQTSNHDEFGESARPALPIEQYESLWEQMKQQKKPFHEFHRALWVQNNELATERKEQTNHWVYNFGSIWRLETNGEPDCVLHDFGDCWVLAFQGCDNVSDYLAATQVS